MLLFTPVGQVSTAPGQGVSIQNTQPIVAESVSTSSVTILNDSVKPAEKKSSTDVATIVKNFFSDIPVLARVARCESTYRQFDADGSVLRGKVNNNDVGVMQINEKYHAKEAKALGLDLYTLEGNMAYAKILYKKQGTSPWNASSSCWGSSVGQIAVATTPVAITASVSSVAPVLNTAASVQNSLPTSVSTL